jgi:hypothetical protein
VKERFISEAQQRLRTIFEALARGEDVAPAQRYRVEGFMAAGVHLQLASEQELAEIMAGLQREILNIEPPCLAADPLTISVVMKRAPVTPST